MLAADAYEPNNNLSEVAALVAGATNSANLGTLFHTKQIRNLSLEDAEDWFRFATTETGTGHDFVRIDFENDFGNLALELYDDTGTRLSTSDASIADEEVISLASRPMGVYFARITGRNGATNSKYTLTINPTGNSDDDPYEPNDSSQAVAVLSPGAVGSANLGLLTSPRTITDLRLEDASDWFRIETSAIGTTAHEIRIDFDNDRGNLGLELWNDFGTRLAITDGSLANEETVSLSTRPPGVYFAKVFGRNGDANSNYTLTVTPPLGTVGAAPEIEVSENGRVIVDGSSESIKFDPAVLFEAEPTRTFLVRNVGNAPLLVGEIQVPENFRVTESLQSSIAPGESDTFTIVRQTTWLSTLYGDVLFATSDHDENVFNFAIESEISPKTITHLGDVFEENDDAFDVAATPPGFQRLPNFGALTKQMVIPHLELEDTEDWFRFATVAIGTSHDHVHIDFDNDEGNLALELYDEFNTRLATSDGSFADQEFISFASRPAGTYYVRILGRNGAINPDYSLTINPPTAFADDLLEPNDSFQQLNLQPANGAASPNFGLVTSRRTVTDLRLEDREDWFRFETASTGTDAHSIRIDFLNDVGNLALELYNANNDRITLSDGSLSNSETISLATLTAGVYYARVIGRDGDANSNYSLSLVPPPGIVTATPEIAVTDDRGQITDGRTESIQFSPSVKNQTGASQTFRVANQGAVPLLIEEFSLPAGFQLIESLDARVAPSSSDTFTIAVDTESAGIHFGQVSFATNDLDENVFNFAIQALVTPTTTTSSGDIFENNDSFFDVDRLTPGDPNSPNFGVLASTTVIEHLSLQDTEDWFRFETTETATNHDFARIDFTSSAGNLALELFDANRNSIRSSDGSFTNEEVILLSSLAPNAYFLRVSGRNGATNADYTLTIDPPGNSADDPYESNDSFAQVSVHTPGALLSPNLGVATSQKVIDNLKLEDANDWFRFETISTGTTNHSIRIDFVNAEGNLALEGCSRLGSRLSCGEITDCYWMKMASVS